MIRTEQAATKEWKVSGEQRFRLLSDIGKACKLPYEATRQIMRAVNKAACNPPVSEETLDALLYVSDPLPF